MLISQIYHKYQIPPNLQRHMFEVAAVAEFLANQFKGQKVNQSLVVESALLHDLGNIVKFKDFITSEMQLDEKVWRQVQKDFVEKYGADAHQTTLSIVKELGLKNEAEIITTLEQSDHRYIASYGYLTLESQLLDYADMCVAPSGIVGFEPRINDLVKRYNLSDNDPSIQTRRANAVEIQKYLDFDLNNLTQIDWQDWINLLSKTEISLRV
jgi:hypothetical protein